jgi:hypothetical protein
MRRPIRYTIYYTVPYLYYSNRTILQFAVKDLIHIEYFVSIIPVPGLVFFSHCIEETSSIIKRQTDFQHVYASPTSTNPSHFPTERPTVTRPAGMLLQKPSNVPGRCRLEPLTPPSWTRASMGAGDEHSLPLMVINQRRQHP